MRMFSLVLVAAYTSCVDKTLGDKCLNPLTGGCDKYVCAKGTWDHCEEYTNVCACNTTYVDGSNDEGKPACCGTGCPTYRATELLAQKGPAACSAEAPCYMEKGDYCTTYSCDTAKPDGQCATFTNVCPCGTLYADGSKDEHKPACCGKGCPTHRATVLVLAATDVCDKSTCAGDKPCLNPANGVCFELNDDHTCAPGTQNCVCPTTCAATKPCLQKSAGLCFPLVGGQCPGGTDKCASDAPSPPVPAGECDNICTDETKPCAHGGVCFPEVGGQCPGGTKECLCKKSCTASAPCGTDKSEACFPLVGGQCPGGTKVCANPSLALFI